MGGTSWSLRFSAWRGCRGRLRFRRCFAIILRWFSDRFDIGLGKNIKATKRYQYDIDQSMRLAENDACQFIWFDDQRVQDTHFRVRFCWWFGYFLWVLELRYPDTNPIMKLHQNDRHQGKIHTWHLKPWPCQKNARQRTLKLNDSAARVWIFQGRNQK